MGADVIIEDARWEPFEVEQLAVRATDATLAHLGLSSDAWDTAVLFADDARLAELNGDFRGKPVPTNVLSWPSEERGASEEGAIPALPEGDPELGDIALAFETVMREAEAAPSVSAHVMHLIIHGTLHLLGYDHVRDGDGDLMESIETAILAKLGLPDPYSGDGPGRPED